MTAFVLGALSFFLTALPARADLKVCNRMSYVVEAAIGIDDNGTTATRGWFRIDPAQCRLVAQGKITAERIFLHARALPLYGASPMPQNDKDLLCVGTGEFIIAGARTCRPGETAVPFTEVKPTQGDDDMATAYLAENSEYDDEQARFAAIQRLLVVAGYDAAPIDGVDGPKTQGALAKFFKDRNLSAATLQSPTFFDTLMAAVQSPASTGLTWCNDTPYRVMAAVGVDDGKATVTRGWYRIDAGKCVHPDIAGKVRRIFSFAEAVEPDGRPLRLNNRPINWGGGSMLCTRESKFEIAEQADCSGRGFVATGFAAVDAGPDTGQTLRFRMP